MAKGFRLVSGGTDNHLMLRGPAATSDITGKELEQPLWTRCYITVNKNAIPNDPEKPVRHLRHPRRHPRCHHPRPEGRGHEGDRPHHGYGRP